MQVRFLPLAFKSHHTAWTQTMHEKAAEWDIKHRVDTSMQGTESSRIWPNGKGPPTNRPCDVCGEPVTIGFIHHGTCMLDQISDLIDKINARKRCQNGIKNHEKPQETNLAYVPENDTSE